MVLTFPFDEQTVAAVKSVAGARFVPRDKGGPFWTLPLDLTAGRRLREVVGEYLTLSPALIEWGRQQVSQERNLGRVAASDDAELSRLPVVAPELHDFLGNRPFQRADVEFMATTSCVNGNQVGMGKTVEVIAATIEAELPGPYLVVAGVTHLLNVWAPQLARHLDDVTVLTGDTPASRARAVVEAAERYRTGDRSFWLLVNHDMIRMQQQRDDERDKMVWVAKHPALFEVEWSAVAIDEYRKVGLVNQKTQLGHGARKLRVAEGGRRWAMSGTPLGGRIWNLWGALNWAEPSRYPSRFRWLEQWGEWEHNGFATSGKKFTGRITKGREDAFYASIAPNFLRRLKREHMTDLPPIDYADPIWCPMTAEQKRQYRAMDADAEASIEGGRLTAAGILAEYTRLKQIATAPLAAGERGRVAMTSGSGKLAALLDKLDEFGIRPAKQEPDGDDKVVVATQFTALVGPWRAEFDALGIPTLAITGKESPVERAEANRLFNEDDEHRVIFINYQAGGSGIDLDRADTIILIDETWDPDDAEQAVGRLDRGRPHPITVYRLMTRGTIDEYIHEVTDGKLDVNIDALELRRHIHHRKSKEA